MATDTRSLPAYFDTDATFRTWGTGIAAQLVACGLVKTSDTGQIDWTTVTKPAAINAAMGYEIYRFSDSFQTLYPVYIKFEYGSGGAIDRPSVFLTLGSASNGSGTITGTYTAARKQLLSGVSKTAGAVFNSYCSGSAASSRIAMVTNSDPTDTTSPAARFGFIIERIRDSTGVVSGNATAYIWSPTASTQTYGLLPYSGAGVTAPASTTSLPVVSDAGGAVVFGLGVCLFPMIYYFGQLYWGTSVFYLSTTLPAFTSFTGTHLGASHTFLPVIPNTILPNDGLAIMWE